MGFRDKLGIVRDFPALRDAFLLTHNFCAKLVHGVAEEGLADRTPASPSPGGLRFAPGDDPRVRESTSCLYQTVCGDDDPQRPFSPRRLGDATPTYLVIRSRLDVGSGLGLRRRPAPRLPSFLSMADALDSPPDTAKGFVDLLEHGSHQNTWSRSARPTRSSGSYLRSVE